MSVIVQIAKQWLRLKNIEGTPSMEQRDYQLICRSSGTKTPSSLTVGSFEGPSKTRRLQPYFLYHNNNFFQNVSYDFLPVRYQPYLATVTLKHLTET